MWAEIEGCVFCGFLRLITVFFLGRVLAVLTVTRVGAGVSRKFKFGVSSTTSMSSITGVSSVGEASSCCGTSPEVPASGSGYGRLLVLSLFLCAK